jgi:murein DD-endopeptidase MepM/ murein hydrolase activator NlpD
VPRLTRVPRFLLRRRTLLATVAASLVAVIPATAAPVAEPLGAVQDSVRAVSMTAPPNQPRPFDVLHPASASVQSRPTPAVLLTGYRWPLDRARITLPFGPTPWGTHIVHGQLFHDGIDLATFCGDRIVAAHDGVVLAAGRHYDRYLGWVGSLDRYFSRLDRKNIWFELPNVVVIDDGNGYRSMYAHLGEVTVKRGERVHAGQKLGYEGATGHATGCHLHFGLFSPLETATFGMKADVARRMRLPRREIARIDPRLVLPERRP